jgi:bacteriocin biosynthesis cyclodehydratase domain-containing protein
VFAKGLLIIPAGDDRVLLKRGIHEMLLSGDGARELLETLVAQLDGSRSAQQIVDSFDADVQPAVQRLLTSLVRRGLAFEDAAEAEELLAGDDPGSAFFRNFLPAARRTPQALRRASVVVTGVNLISRTLVRGLLESGIGRVLLARHPVLDHPLDAERWTAALAAASGPERLVLSDDLPAAEELSEASLIVAGSDFGQAEALMDLNRRALELALPFLPIWLEELIGHVGPLHYPYETACLRCYQLRTDSNHDDWQLRRAVREHATADDEARGTTGLVPPMAGVLGEIGAMEVLKVVGELVPSDVVGRQIEINLVSFRSTVRRVLKVPRCPECSEITRTAPMVLIRGPQIAQRS